MSKEETIIFFQILRITNSLEFWTRLFLVMPKEQNKIFEERNQMELYFAIISFYKETTKEFSRNLVKGLLKMNLSEPLSLKITEYNTWLKNWKQDEYLQVVNRIRNDLRFHVGSSIYEKYIKEGNESEDLLVDVVIGEQHKDFLYTEPYTFEFEHIFEIVPVSAGSTGEDKMDWIQKRTSEETSKFVRLLREIIREMFKGNAYRKIIDN